MTSAISFKVVTSAISFKPVTSATSFTAVTSAISFPASGVVLQEIDLAAVTMPLSRPLACRRTLAGLPAILLVVICFGQLQELQTVRTSETM